MKAGNSLRSIKFITTGVKHWRGELAENYPELPDILSLVLRNRIKFVYNKLL